MHDIFGFIETGIILTVLIVEIFILFNARKETRERKALINELGLTRRRLGRESYLEMIKKGLSEAKESIIFVATSLEPRRPTNELYSHMEGLRLKEYKAVVPEESSKIKAMLELMNRGVEVKVHSFANVSNFRFNVIDEEKVIIGLSRREDEPSTEGIWIENKVLAKILRDFFLKLFHKAKPLDIFIKESIKELLEANPTWTEEFVRKQLGLEQENNLLEKE